MYLKYVLVILALMTLWFLVRELRNKKLEFLYDKVIHPANVVFFRASSLYLIAVGKDFGKKCTSINDYISLFEDIERCKNMFYKHSEYYKNLDFLAKECKKRFEAEWRHIYKEKEYNEIINKIYSLRKFYLKHTKFYYRIEGFPQL